jgi:tetratricopeptide (TPR) repeat protein
VAVLLRAKRWAEIRPLAKDSEAVQQKDTVLLVATTMIEGPQAALEESRRLSGSARRAALAGAARSLLDFREYKRAIPLFEAASAGAPNAQQLRTLNDVLKKTQRWEELKFPDSDPESVVKKFLVEIVAGKGEIRSLLGADMRQEFDRNPRQTNMVQYIARLMAERLKEPGLSLDTAVDLSFGRMLTFKEGDDASGYRIRIAPDGTAGKRDQVYLVVKEENAYRLLTAGFYVAPAGKEALRRADRGDLAGAKRILDWIRELQKPEGGDDPLQGPAFAHLWPVYAQEEAGLIRLSAAVLLAEDPDFAAGAIEILEKDLPTQTSDETKLWVERALAEAYASTKNWKQLERVSAGLFEKKPASTEAARFLVTALRRQSKFAEAEAVANRLAAKRPNSEEAVRLLSETAVDKNDLAAARRHVETLIERGDANSQDYNLLAWMSLFSDGPSEKALETAQKANDLSGGVSYGALHTQAVLLAEMDRSAEAYQTILKAISFSGEEEPIPTDWYVFARLAENYGYPDVARSLYQRAKPSKVEDDEERHLSTWELAQKRMAALPAATVVKGKARK